MCRGRLFKLTFSHALAYLRVCEGGREGREGREGGREGGTEGGYSGCLIT